MSAHPIIGSKYSGPPLDRPCLRMMPREWILEETRATYRAPWYMRADRWLVIFAALMLLVACAQAWKL